MLGVDAASGDTYASKYPYCTLQSMFVPEPVIKMAVAPANRDGADRLGKALQRFRREDPTLNISVDEETGETIMAGMGELHLEIYIERIRREFKVEVEVGAAEGELSRGADANGRVQHAAQEADRRLRPVRPHQGPPGRPARGFPGVVRLRGRSDRRAGAEAVHSRGGKGLSPVHPQGAGRRLSGRRLEGHARRRLVSRSGQLRHGVPDVRRTCMRENFSRTRPVLLEPVMKIEIECPAQFQGSVVGNLTSRRGMVVATEMDGPTARIEGEVPLAETFGYSTDLRSMTQGQGTFTMEFARYRRLPPSIEREVIAARKTAAMAGAVQAGFPGGGPRASCRESPS